VTTTSERPTYTLTFRAEADNTDAIKSLRLLLKVALRRFKLRCISANEEK
jgi:hypothetical protein